MANLRLEVLGLEGEVQTLSRVTQFDDLFAKTRKSPKGGRMQYPWTMTRLIIEHLVTGASVSAVEKTLQIIPQTLAPGRKFRDSPKSKLINKCRTVMKTVGECCTAILLGRARRWLQVYSDGTSVSNAELVDIVLHRHSGRD